MCTHCSHCTVCDLTHLCNTCGREGIDHCLINYALGTLIYHLWSPCQVSLQSWSCGYLNLTSIVVLSQIFHRVLHPISFLSFNLVYLKHSNLYMGYRGISRGSIVFTTFILHSLRPIVFLETVKEKEKIKISIVLFRKLKMQPFYLRSAKSLSFSTRWANERWSLQNKENLVCNSSPSKFQHRKH